METNWIKDPNDTVAIPSIVIIKGENLDFPVSFLTSQVFSCFNLYIRNLVQHVYVLLKIYELKMCAVAVSCLHDK